FDGMRGASSGEVASQIARGEIQNSIGNIPEGLTFSEAEESMRRIFLDVNQTILDEVKNDHKLYGMGTTGTVVKYYIDKNGSRGLLVGHVGDSRAYLKTLGGILEQITEDDNNIPIEIVKAISNSIDG